MKMILALIALSLGYSARADITSELPLLRRLAPAGYDVAMIQAARLIGASESDAVLAAEFNFARHDFTKDGIEDLVVIFEAQPTVADRNGAPCAQVNWEVGCDVVYGERVMQFFAGDRHGGFTKISENRAMILRGDEGGVWGEPLAGLHLNSKGSVVLSFYGGSAWRWGNDYTFQYRGDDLYLVGTDTVESWNGDGRFESTSINLITGRRVDSWSAGLDAPTHSKVSRVPVLPLQRLGDLEPEPGC